jgi:hypothetical protein
VIADFMFAGRDAAITKPELQHPEAATDAAQF